MRQAIGKLDPSRQVTVTAPARLHLGFLDMGGALGRRFGSIGLTIDGYQTRVRARPAARLLTSGDSADRALRYARQMLAGIVDAQPLDISVEQATPGHLGLGSGTQLALAVGAAISRLHGIEAGSADIAQALGRGSRSGIGIAAFDRGGLLVDGGNSPQQRVPPLITRMAFPEQWRVVLLLDVRGKGLHGQQEVEAFKRLPPFPRQLAAHICHLTLMQILPAVQEQDLPRFGAGIAEVQRLVGDHFAPAQGGRFTSDAVARALSLAEQLGLAGVGQSSWGPTGFVFVPDEAAGQRLIQQLTQRLGEVSPLRYRLVSGLNQGGSIELSALAHARREAN